MPLYEGEELVPVSTPDGRTLMLPRSAVPGGAGPAPIAFGVAGGPNAAPPIIDTPTSVTDGLVPLGENPGAQPGYGFKGAEYGTTPVQNGPDYKLGTVDVSQIAKQQAADKAKSVADAKKKTKADKAAAAYAATPAGQLAGAAGKQDAAQSNEQQAVFEAADLEAATQDVVAGAVEQRNKTLDTLFQNRANEMNELAQAEDAKMQEIVGLRKKMASKKIDRDLDRPVLVGIFAALAGLGSAMKGEKVETFDLINRIIDRKVAAQEADLDRMAKTYGMTREELNDLKEKSKRKLEFHNTMIAWETDKAIRQIEEITAKSASEKTKANAKILIAQLQQRAADKTMEATRWGLDYDQKERHQKEQQATSRYGIAVQDRHNRANEQIAREGQYLDYQKALAADRARGDIETYKARMEAQGAVQKTGLRDMNGDLFLTPQGRAKLEQAKQLEQQASDVEAKYKNDPMGSSVKANEVQRLRDQAAVLRGDAQTFDVVKAHNDTEAVQVSNMIASGQSVVQLIDDIKAVSDQAGRGLISRSAAQAKLQSMFQQLKPGLKEAWQLGAWDKGSAALVETIIGADPSSDWNAGALGSIIAQKMYEDPNSFKGRLDSVAEQLETSAKNRLVGLGTKFGKDETVLRRAKEVPVTQEDEMSRNLTQARSGVELANNAEQVGTVGKVARAVGYPFSPNHKEEAESAQSVKYPGLSKDQDEAFGGLVATYKKGGPEGQRAGEELVSKVVNAAKERPDLAIPLLHNLRDNPATKELYVTARMAVPKDSDVDKQMVYEEQNRVATAPLPAQDAADMVIATMKDDGTITDWNDWRELGARAGRGDADAKKAMAEVIKASNTRKTMPKGSVFRNNVR